MTERFGKKIPNWLRNLLYWTFLTAYIVVLIIGVIGVTWPQNGLDIWQWGLARISGGVTIASATVCVASYVKHRWKWELWGVLGASVALAGYVLVISTVAPLASRGLLLAAMTLVVIGLYIRLLDCIARTHRWSDGRQAGRKFDETRRG